MLLTDEASLQPLMSLSNAELYRGLLSLLSSVYESGLEKRCVYFYLFLWVCLFFCVFLVDCFVVVQTSSYSFFIHLMNAGITGGYH